MVRYKWNSVRQTGFLGLRRFPGFPGDFQQNSRWFLCTFVRQKRNYRYKGEIIDLLHLKKDSCRKGLNLYHFEKVNAPKFVATCLTKVALFQNVPENLIHSLSNSSLMRLNQSGITKKVCSKSLVSLVCCFSYQLPGACWREFKSRHKVWAISVTRRANKDGWFTGRFTDFY